MSWRQCDEEHSRGEDRRQQSATVDLVLVELHDGRGSTRRVGSSIDRERACSAHREDASTEFEPAVVELTANHARAARHCVLRRRARRSHRGGAGTRSRVRSAVREHEGNRVGPQRQVGAVRDARWPGVPDVLLPESHLGECSDRLLTTALDTSPRCHL